MIDYATIVHGSLHETPYRWAEIGGLYGTEDAAALAATFPRDRFKTVLGYGGEKDYAYEARALIPMGASSIAYEDGLSDAWRRLAHDLGSAAYRSALSQLTGCDLTSAPLEVNVFHYGPGALLGPHADLPDKVVTHVLYFNATWSVDDGGCLTVLRAKDAAAVAATVAPVVGNSAVIVRSDDSWHAVSPVVCAVAESRRSLTATFYRPGAESSMWPPGDAAELHDIGPEIAGIGRNGPEADRMERRTGAA